MGDEAGPPVGGSPQTMSFKTRTLVVGGYLASHPFSLAYHLRHAHRGNLLGSKKLPLREGRNLLTHQLLCFQLEPLLPPWLYCVLFVGFPGFPPYWGAAEGPGLL